MTHDERTYKLGDRANGFVLTESGWVKEARIGDRANGQVLTPHGWMLDTPPRKTPFAALLLIGSVIGLVMALQSASLLSGTGTQWIGFTITVGSCIAIAALYTRTTLWVWVTALIASAVIAALALASVVYLEVELDKKRRDIEGIFPDLINVR